MRHLVFGFTYVMAAGIFFILAVYMSLGGITLLIHQVLKYAG